jgi:arginine deiminase
MSKKKPHDPVASLKKAFRETVEDPELHERWVRFQRDLERAKREHNEIVPVVNSNLAEIRTLKESILNLAMLGIISTEARDRVLKLEADNEDLIHQIERWKAEIEENEKLIGQYEKASDHKLFVWWQALRAVDPGTLSWLEWKEDYKDQII